MTGEYEFTWKLVIGDDSADEGDFQVRSEDIRGRFRLIAPAPAAPPKNSLAPGNGRYRS